MIFTLSVIAGIIVCKNSILITVIFAGLLVSYLLTFLLKRRHIPFVLILGFSLGLLLSFNADKVYDSPLYKFKGESVKAEIEVLNVPVKADNYVKFMGCVKSINDTEVKEKVIVYVYNEKNIAENSKVTFDGIKFNIPDSNRNFGSFDYRKYLTGKNIYFTATADKSKITEIESLEMNLPRRLVSFSAYLERRVDKTLPGRTADIFKAVLLGKDDYVDEQTIESFRESGLSHIMAVSGLHLTILVMFLGLFIKRLNKWLRFIITTIFIIVFSAIVGFPYSVIRAAVMLIVITFADCLLIEGDSITNLSLIALILIIINPNTIYDTGFVMSFTATLGILSLYTYIRSKMPVSMPNSIKDSIAITLSAQVGTLPFSVINFGQFSLLAIISNLLIVILLPLIYLFGIISVITGFSMFVNINVMMVDILIWWTKFCSSIPGQIQHIPYNAFVIFGISAFSLSFLTITAWKNRRNAITLIIMSLFITLSGILWQIKPVNNTKITFLNVEQSDCSLVQSGTTAFLVDSGTEYMGKAEVVDYLLRNGVKRLDGIFVSHFDIDHSGGLTHILENVDVSVVYIPDTIDVGKKQYEFLQYAIKNNIPVYTLKAGDKIKMNDVDIKVLHPEENKVLDGKNDSSLVFRAENSDMSILFPGDLEKDNILKDCDTDLLKVSHHGSKNGSTEEFLHKCTPKIAVISLAENNMYGFPHENTIEKLSKYTDKIYRTDLNGTIEVYCDDYEYKVKTLR